MFVSESLININDKFIKFIKENLNNENSYNTWFKNINIIKLESNLAIITVPNSFTKKFLEKSYYKFINNILNNILKRDVTIKLVENNSKEYKYFTEKDIKINNKQNHLSLSNLNPKYTFENFVVGENNRFAHAACLAAAENPAKIYNPIFIYGGVGLGKTHLMHALGHRYLNLNPKANILYVSTETFTNELINAIRNGKIDKFREKYRTINLLLIDDIQFLENKEKTQDEFFHTFNALKDSDKQIVISSDDAPNKLKIEERLSSRFGWGLITDIGQPDFETRIAILRYKAEKDNIFLPEEVYYFIAERITSNIRELEGALLRIDAYTSLNKIKNNEINENLINSIIKDMINNQTPMHITDQTIKMAVANFYSIRIEDLNSKIRTRNI